jgi:hypothetical protein
MENKLHPKVLLVLVTIFLSISYTNQLQSSHTRTLLRIKRLLNFPSILSSWNSTTDFCNTDSKASLSVVCYEQTITQLHIVGETKPQQLLPKNFSIDSFFTTLLRIPTLKVLTLVSLGLWGPLPSKISGLSSLEIVNMSSNFLYGKIPQELPLLSNLQALILDNNMFDGHLPDWLDSFPSLTVLNLNQNLFNGSLPDSLSSLTNMRVLSLSHNHFYGSVPDLSRLVNLQVLELDDNSFGPNFPRTYNKLVTCVLRNNKFRSSLPDNMSSYYQLERFDISENAFVGPFQLELFSLPAISYINISSNKLSGMLFENLSCNSLLEEVDLSSNLLTGRLPKCLVSNSYDRKFLYGGNCLEDTNQNQHEQAFCHTEAIAVGIGPDERKKHKRVSKTVLAFEIIGGIFGGISLVALIFMIMIRRGNGKSMMMKKNSKTKLISENVASGKLISDSSKKLSHLIIDNPFVFIYFNNITCAYVLFMVRFRKEIELLMVRLKRNQASIKVMFTGCGSETELRRKEPNCDRSRTKLNQTELVQFNS